jgi:hypothetical protein
MSSEHSLASTSYSKVGVLSANIKLTVNKPLIRSVITYACPAWELAGDTYFFKLQRMQNKVLCTTRNLSRCKPVHDLHKAFNLPCRQKAEVKQNHVKERVHRIGQGEANTENITGLNLVVIKLKTVRVTKLPL